MSKSWCFRNNIPEGGAGHTLFLNHEWDFDSGKMASIQSTGITFQSKMSLAVTRNAILTLNRMNGWMDRWVDGRTDGQARAEM